MPVVDSDFITLKPLPPSTPYSPVIVESGNERIRFLVRRCNNIKLQTVIRILCPALTGATVDGATIEEAFQTMFEHLVWQKSLDVDVREPMIVRGPGVR